jgi:hypothetical protein
MPGGGANPSRAQGKQECLCYLKAHDEALRSSWLPALLRDANMRPGYSVTVTLTFTVWASVTTPTFDVTLTVTV